MGGALLYTHLILGSTPPPSLVLFYLLVVFGASKSIKESLDPWKKGTPWYQYVDISNHHSLLGCHP